MFNWLTVTMFMHYVGRKQQDTFVYLDIQWVTFIFATFIHWDTNILCTLLVVSTLAVTELKIQQYSDSLTSVWNQTTYNCTLTALHQSETKHDTTVQWQPYISQKPNTIQLYVYTRTCYRYRISDKLSFSLTIYEMSLGNSI